MYNDNSKGREHTPLEQTQCYTPYLIYIACLADISFLTHFRTRISLFLLFHGSNKRASSDPTSRTEFAGVRRRIPHLYSPT